MKIVLVGSVLARNSSSARDLMLIQFGVEAPGEKKSGHAVVADQGPERRLKGGGLVLLDEEMPDPRRCIAENGHGEQPPPILRDDCPDQHNGGSNAAEIVQGARLGLAVLPEVEWPEFRVALEFRIHAGSSLAQGFRFFKA